MVDCHTQGINTYEVVPQDAGDIRRGRVTADQATLIMNMNLLYFICFISSLYVIGHLEAP